MINIRLKGGLGNQMFQYALGLKLAHDLNTDLHLDLSSLLDRSKGDFVYRNYDLSIFNVNDAFTLNPKLLEFIYKPKSSTITKMVRKHLAFKYTVVNEKHFHLQTTLLIIMVLFYLRFNTLNSKY